MHRLILALVLLVLPVDAAHASDPAKTAVLYRNPQCGCCGGYADYLRDNGLTVIVKPTSDLSPIKRKHGMPEQLESCHTMLIDRYVIEGHVPLRLLDRLLTERPNIKGISLPGMPVGSPGMGGEKTGPFTIYEVADGALRVYAVE